MATHKQKKQKQFRNISGLRNQANASPVPSASSQHCTAPRSRAPSPEEDGDESDEDLELLLHFDSLKTNFQNEEVHEYDENDEGEECIQDWEGFDSLEMSNAMGEMIKADNPNDLDWMPPKMRKELERREQLKKSEHTQCESGLKRPLKMKSSKADILQEGTRCYEQI